MHVGLDFHVVFALLLIRTLQRGQRARQRFLIEEIAFRQTGARQHLGGVVGGGAVKRGQFLVMTLFAAAFHQIGIVAGGGAGHLRHLFQDNVVGQYFRAANHQIANDGAFLHGNNQLRAVLFQQHVFVKAAGIKRADNAFTRCIGINIACFHGKQAAHGGFGSVLFAFDAEIADCKIGCPNRGGKTHGHKCDGKLLEFHHLLSKK